MILNGMVWKDPTKVAFEQKLEENEEAGHAGFWGASSRKREPPLQKPEEGACLANSRNRKEASV